MRGNRYMSWWCSTPVAVLLALAAWLGAPAAWAAEFHVVVGDQPGGTGSAQNPWDLATAFGHPAAVQPGDTIWLHGGTYPISGNLTSVLTGTSDLPIVVRQAAGERATLDTGDTPANRVIIDGQYTWYWGFEITSSAADRWAADGVAAQRGYSIDVGNNGGNPGIRLINLVVHDTGGAIGFWSGVTEGEVYGCLIYYNGYDYSDRGHGHAIYTQNVSGPKRIADNVLFGQYSHGVHAYTEGGQINDFLLEGNIGFENGVVSTISGRTRNLLIGGTPVAQDPTVRQNYAYFDPAVGDGTSCDLGYGAGTANAIVQDNVLVGGGTAFRIASTNPTVTGNTIYGPSDGADAVTFPNNVFGQSPPTTGAAVFVRPNEYDTDRANVVAFNWALAASVDADPSDLLVPGDLYELRDVQDYFGPAAATGSYQGGTIPLPMDRTDVSAVTGTPATPFVHTSAQFGAFVLLRTGHEDPGTGGGGAGGNGTGGSAGSGGSGATGASAGAQGPAEEDSGCGCRLARDGSAGGAGWLAMLSLVLLGRRRAAAGGR